MIENIEMLPDLKKNLKRIALEKNTTMRKLITDKVKNFIKKCSYQSFDRSFL